MFWVLKRTDSLRRFFLVPITYMCDLVEKLENYFFVTVTLSTIYRSKKQEMIVNSKELHSGVINNNN